MGIWQDIRYGARSLSRHRNLTLVSVAVLALGIGANTALFTVTHAVLQRPVSGVQNPDQLVLLVRVQNGQEYSNAGYPDYVDYRDQNRCFAGLVAERGIPISFAQRVTERIAGSIVTGNYFNVLGVKPALGRLLTPDDDRTSDAHPVAVLSHNFWLRGFATDPAAIGQKMMLNGYAFTIVGVASEEFHGMRIGEQVDVWLPMMMQNEAMPRYTGTNMLSHRSAGWLTLYGRLGPGVSMERARSEVAAIARNLERAYPETNTGRSATVTRDVGLDQSQRRDLRTLLGLLLASVALLLLIACQNIANLLLARAAGRRREIAVRLAVGASQWRLMRQLMVESLLVCLLASGLALLIAPFTIELALKVLGPADIALRTPTRLDGTVLLFTFGLTLATGLLFGLAPALQASKTDVVSFLKAAAPSPTEWRPGKAPRLATLLLVGQIAVSAVLLVAGGLVMRSMLGIFSIRPGFETNRVLLAAVDLAIQRYSEPQGKQFAERLAQRLMANPEVESVSLSKSEPARDWADRRQVFYPGQEPLPAELRRNPDLGVRVDANLISPGYFRTLGIPLVAGRDFTWHDRAGAAPVAIVSERLAERLWPHQSVLGKRIVVPDTGEPPRPALEVVGVARDAKYRSILTEAPMLFYQPMLQHYDSFVTIEVRTRRDPAAFAATLRREIATLDANLPVYAVRTLKDQVDRSLWQQRSAAVLIGIFGLISLTLASLGMYSQLAHAVAARTREIGIRMALGAGAEAVRRHIVGQGLLMSAIGATAGLLAALPLVRFAEGLLYGVTALDPIAFGAAWMILVTMTIPASYFPARAATRVDPMAALRAD